MTEPKGRPPGSDPATGKAAVGQVLDAVRWDYDPEEEELSPLVSTERYFRDFPWSGVDEADSGSGG